MKAQATALASGLLFGLGLGVSGMTHPSKVIGFLDVAGTWDPSLAFVMLGALAVHIVLFRLVKRRASPLFDTKFHLPTRADVDGRLVVGAALWYLTKDKQPRATTTSAAIAAPAPRSTSSTATPARVPRNCAVHIDSSGITVDGIRAELGDAVRRCAAAGGAAVTVAPNAPASTCATFVAALERANIPVRNARRRNTGKLHIRHGVR